MDIRQQFADEAKQKVYLELVKLGLNPQQNYSLGHIISDFAFPKYAVVIQFTDAGYSKERKNNLLYLQKEGWKRKTYKTTHAYYYPEQVAKSIQTLIKKSTQTITLNKLNKKYILMWIVIILGIIFILFGLFFISSLLFLFQEKIPLDHGEEIINPLLIQKKWSQQSCEEFCKDICVIEKTKPRYLSELDSCACVFQKYDVICQSS